MRRSLSILIISAFALSLSAQNKKLILRLNVMDSSQVDSIVVTKVALQDILVDSMNLLRSDISDSLANFSGGGGTDSTFYNSNNSITYDRIATLSGNSVTFLGSARSTVINSQGHLGVGGDPGSNYLYVYDPSGSPAVEIETGFATGNASFNLQTPSITWSFLNKGIQSGRLVFSDGTNEPLSIEPGALTNTLFISDGSYVGINNSDPLGRIHVTGTSEQVGIFERVETGTTNTYVGFQSRAKTSGDMADGFGTGIDFRGEDSTSGSLRFGYIVAKRDGADTEGELVFASGTNGNDIGLRIRSNQDVLIPDGKIGFGTDSPTATLHGYEASSTVGFLVEQGNGSALAYMSGLNNSKLMFADNLPFTISYNSLTNVQNLSGAGRTDLIYVDPATDYIGLGANNTSPSSTLDVKGGDILIDNDQYYRGKDSGGTGRRIFGVNSGDDVAIGGTNLDDIVFNVGGLTNAMVLKQTTGVLELGNYGSGNNTGTQAYNLSVDSNGKVIETTPGGSGRDSTVYFYHEESSGTSGGTLESNAWRERTLNVYKGDSSIVTAFSGNKFNLNAGTYDYEGYSVGYKVGNHQAALYNVTDLDRMYGSNARSDSSDSSATESRFSGRFTITANKQFNIVHRSQNTQNTNGFGNNNGFGGTQVYAMVKITKIYNP